MGGRRMADGTGRTVNLWTVQFKIDGGSAHWSRKSARGNDNLGLSCQAEWQYLATLQLRKERWNLGVVGAGGAGDDDDGAEKRKLAEVSAGNT